MSSGKKENFYFLLIVTAMIITSTQTHMTTLRNGLLFDKTGQETAINGRVLTLRRRISTVPMYNALSILQTATKTFASLCEKTKRAVHEKNYTFSAYKKGLPSSNTPKYEFKITEKTYLRLASTACHKINGTLPEIRTPFDYDEIRHLVDAYNLKYVPANIKFDMQSRRVRFVSDGAEPVTSGWNTKVHMYHVANTIVPHHELYFLDAARHGMIAYAYFKDVADPRVKALDDSEAEQQHRVICQRPRPTLAAPPKLNNYDHMAVHLCDRDMRHNEAVTAHLANTINEIFNQSNVPMNYNLPTATDQQKQKRLAMMPAIALGIGGSAIGGGFLSSSFTGKSPLGLIGTAAGRLFGLATSDDLEVTWAAIKNNSIAINDLMVNFDRAMVHYTQVQKSLAEIKTQMILLDESLTIYLQLQDVQQLIQSMTNMIFTLLGDVVGSFADTASGIYNSLLLTPAELDQQQNAFSKRHNLKLDITPAAVKTALFRTTTDFNVLYMVPILEPENRAHIYTVSSLPFFHHGKAYRPNIDTKHIAFFTSLQEYTVLTADEYLTCKQTPWLCTAASAKAPVSDPSNCVAQSFLGQRLACPLLEVNETLSEFRVRGNSLIYSTNSSETVYVNCRNNSMKLFEQTLYLQGMGIVALPQDCQILLPRNRRHTTSATGYLVELSDSQFFKPLEQNPNYTDLVLKAPEKISFMEIPPLNLTKIKPVDITELLHHTFHYENTFRVLSPVIVALMVVASLILACCCCNKCVRQYCSTCLLLRPQYVWMGRIQQAAQGDSRPARILRRWAKIDTPIPPTSPILREPPKDPKEPAPHDSMDATMTEHQKWHQWRSPKRHAEDPPSYNSHPQPEPGMREALLTFLPLPPKDHSDCLVSSPPKKARNEILYPPLPKPEPSRVVNPGLLPMPMYPQRPPVSEQEMNELTNMLQKLKISDPTPPIPIPGTSGQVQETKF
jgi:hypothetical protein